MTTYQEDCGIYYVCIETLINVRRRKIDLIGTERTESQIRRKMVT